MQFHEEIEKLQARVAALEAKFGLDVPATDEAAPAAYTLEYLATLSVDAIGDLYKTGKIDVGQLGAAVTRKVFPQGVPEELAPRVTTQAAIPAETGDDAPAVVEPVADVVEPVDEAETEVEDTHADEPAAADDPTPEVEDEGLES